MHLPGETWLLISCLRNNSTAREREKERESEMVSGHVPTQADCAVYKYGVLCWKGPGLRFKLTVWQTGLSAAITCLTLPGLYW